MPRYLLHFLMATLTWAAALLGLNWSVDPYATFHRLAQQDVLNERVFKSVSLAQQPAQTVLLGNSLVDLGFANTGNGVHNLAIFGQTLHETHRLMQQLVQHSPPQRVWLGLDFYAFNALAPVPSDFTEANFVASRPWQLAFSISTGADAWKKLRHNGMGECCDAQGFRALPATPIADYPRAFANNERVYLMEKYLPFPACRFAYQRGNEANTLDEFRDILQLAQQHHIELVLFIPPSHALQWETLAVAGLWSDWENWKRQLFMLNQRVAQQSGRAAFALWDFSGYHTINTEPVPPAGSGAQMTGYTDSAHFSPAVGAQLLARLQGAETPVDFGVPLTTDNINSHLSTLRQAQQHYRAAHPHELAALNLLAQETARAKHCAPKNQPTY